MSRLIKCTLCFVVVACLAIVLIQFQTRPTIIWSAQTRSPDGGWLVTATTKQQSGPGTDEVYTEVYLERTAGRRVPMEIFSFTDNPQSIHVQLNWLTTSHLEITYPDFAEVDFQAVRCAGIEISIREHTNAK